ncbi:MAG: ABC1 kinase family protein [Chloroflexota bacterium]
MPKTTIHRRRRNYQILRLFFGLVLSFLVQYLRARLSSRSYDFFQDAKHNRQRAIRIRDAALEMGGVLIKVGQFLSSRVDLLPTEYIEELALLQDEVPGVPFDQIRQVIEQDLQAPLDRLFATVDPVPVAAASLGQVHRGTLLTGQPVAIKVQRPGIADIVEADLHSLTYIVHWLDRHTVIGRRVNLPEILTEFEDTLRLELDYLAEGHHAERLAIELRNDYQIAIPRIYWSASGSRTLTLEYMRGTKVTDFAALDAQGISRSSTAEILMRAYLYQVLIDGFFHADPHPGNVFVRPGPVVVLVDFGMVGDISPRTREDIRRVFLGIVRRDYDTVLAALGRLGFIAKGADVQILKRSLRWTVETFYELSFAELKAVNPQHVLDELQDVFYTESFRIPANYAFLGRALGTLSGLATALDPSFQFVTVAEPFARKLLRGETGLRGVAGHAAHEAATLANALYSIPRLSHEVLQDFQAGGLTIRHELDEVSRAVERLETTMRRLLYALLGAGFLVAGSFIFHTSDRPLAVGAFIVALILLILVLFPIRRRRRKAR